LQLVLLGHSMGGAVAAHAAAGWDVPGTALRGLVVLDVVEDAAVAALQGMAATAAALAALRFPSPADAVAWAVDSGTLRLHASAALSVPYQLRRVEERAGGEGRGGDGGDGGAFEWAARAFLVDSAPYWREWFQGSTAAFLAAAAPTLLLLADPTSMGAALIVAQMQGRFQLGVVPGAGHVLHEDAPDVVATATAAFLARHGVGTGPDDGELAARLARARAGLPAVAPVTAPRVPTERAR
jgi:protein phosphatase methylesterase 1